jgi:hypothetical protein
MGTPKYCDLRDYRYYSLASILCQWLRITWTRSLSEMRGSTVKIRAPTNGSLCVITGRLRPVTARASQRGWLTGHKSFLSPSPRDSESESGACQWSPQRPNFHQLASPGRRRRALGKTRSIKPGPKVLTGRQAALQEGALAVCARDCTVHSLLRVLSARAPGSGRQLAGPPCGARRLYREAEAGCAPAARWLRLPMLQPPLSGAGVLVQIEMPRNLRT